MAKPTSTTAAENKHKLLKALDKDRENRRGAALQDNLRKRKKQQRARKTSASS